MAIIIINLIRMQSMNEIVSLKTTCVGSTRALKTAGKNIYSVPHYTVTEKLLSLS